MILRHIPTEHVPGRVPDRVPLLILSVRGTDDTNEDLRGIEAADYLEFVVVEVAG